MKTLFTILLIWGFGLMAQGRAINLLTYQQMFEEAGLVAIARPTSTNDTLERTKLLGIGPPIDVIGVATEFLVRTVVKGDKGATNKTIVLHHYREVTPKVYVNGMRPLVAKPIPRAVAFWMPT